MASGATVKMGVDVTQFKQGMQQAQQSAKTLNAQMKANESQFKATGDKEKYLTEKSKLLKEQLNAQKTAAANAEKALEAMRKNGVEKTSTEYQKMEQALAGAQSAMYDTQAAMNALTTSEGKAADGASTLSTNLNSISKKVSFDAVISGIDKITGAMEKAGQKVLQVGQGIWDAVVDAAALSDDYATMASQLDMDVEEFQKHKKVFDTYAELTIKDWMNAKRKIEGVIYNPSQTQIDYLQALGIDTRESINTGNNLAVVQGAAKKWEDVFWEVATALKQKVESGEMTAELADTYGEALFGKAFMHYKPMIDMGEEAFKKAVSDQSAADKKSIEAGANLNDSLILLKGNIETLKLEILGALAPALTQAADSLSGLLNSVLEYLQTEDGQKALQDMETAVSGLFDDLGKIDPAKVVEGFTGVFNRIVEGLKWLNENKGVLAGVLTAIVSGWATAKIVGGALQVLELVNGLITLKNTRKIDIPQLDGNGGLNGGGGGSTGQQTVTSQDVASQNVQSGTITSGTFNFTSGSTQTETVQTMYVQNMIGGPSTGPSINNNPVINDGSGGRTSLPYTQPIGLPSGGSTGLNGYTPILLPSGGGAKIGGASQKALPAGDISSGAEVIDMGDGTRVVFNSTSGASQVPDITIGADTIFFGGDLGLAGSFAISETIKPIQIQQAADLYLNELLKKYGLDMDNPEVRAAVEGAVYGYTGGEFDPTKPETYAKLMAGAKNGVITLPGDIEQQFAEIAQKYGSVKNGHFSMSQNRTLDEITAGTGNWFIGAALKGAKAAIDIKKGVDDTVEDAALWGAKTVLDIKNGLDDTVVDVAMWGAKAALEAKKNLVDPLQESFNDIFAKIYKLSVDIVPTGNSKFDYFSPTSGGGTTTWFSRLVGTTSSMHANGLFSVPWDGYPAILHKGERVLTARENQQYTYNNYFGNVNLNNGLEIEALTESIDRRNRRQRSGYGAA